MMSLGDLIGEQERKLEKVVQEREEQKQGVKMKHMRCASRRSSVGFRVNIN